VLQVAGVYGIGNGLEFLEEFADASVAIVKGGATRDRSAGLKSGVEEERGGGRGRRRGKLMAES
jgi:hypothetical protein